MDRHDPAAVMQALTSSSNESYAVLMPPPVLMAPAFRPPDLTELACQRLRPNLSLVARWLWRAENPLALGARLRRSRGG